MDLCASVLLAGMIVGILIGLAQAVTQIQEQAVSFVPKAVGHGVGDQPNLATWLINQMVQYSHDLIRNIQTIPNNSMPVANR